VYVKEVEVKSEEEVIADDVSSLVPKTMAEEEEKLLKARAKEEEEKIEVAPNLNDSQFNKLDELLTQTKLYSEFLLEKMDDITMVYSLLTLFVFLFCFYFFPEY
jgi:ATP-dependent DNA helicase